ncbi:MAG: hypothetical protein KKE42_11850 [Alphaproteobacteria bacterium]|uniref:CC_3452 family protein n=1 Tax=Brevundimonas sp. TaxID=1871086 RepID=UPI001E155A13|nr:hypothetical protein [Brevundimonas sp.]MBU3974477.1 hypothetical protein [Alphaproteobacteria bacterium]MBU4040290.1 hypothetical protein [Alphaproteobacteria bacterium]MBU4137531.1 hypothetical protein [Alphaproteobacteria bacterium]
MLLMTLISTAALISAQPVPVAPGAGAGAGAGAVLAAPGEARSEVFDGRRWTCAPDGVCVARGPGLSQPAGRECRRFVARFGAVARYERDGAALSEAQLAQCNTAAR